MPTMNDQTQTATPTIQAYALGPFATNCYVVSVPGSPACWIIDASFNPQPMIDAIRAADLEPEAIILTHAHVDHIAGLDQLRSAFPGVDVHLHPEEHPWLTDPVQNLSAGMGEMITTRPAEHALAHNQTLELSGTNWQVRHTPGHSPGSVSFIHEPSNQAIVGDTLFAGSIGRFDFPTSNEQDLYRSIKEQLYTLNPDTRVYPGHGPATTIANEMRNNPYVRAD